MKIGKIIKIIDNQYKSLNNFIFIIIKKKKFTINLFKI